jgi:putative heme-binding domain-containing protein
LKNLAQRTELTQGKYVSAGDRFELLHPGYGAVIAQFSEPRYDLKVESTALSADRRTLFLNTKPHTTGVNYSISMAGWSRPSKPEADATRQLPDMELVTDLGGIQAHWTSAEPGSNSVWHGWLPHLNLEVARRFTEGSAEHQALWPDLLKPGLLELRGQLDLWEMLQPSIQPGAKLDYERTPEEVTVAFSAAQPFRVQFQKNWLNSEATSEGRQQVLLNHRSQEAWLPFELSIPTGQKPVDLTAVWFTAVDPRPRAFQLRRFLLPWAEPDGSTNHSQQVTPPEIAGGDWLEGRNLFFSPAVNCQRCHTIRAEGQHVGPDLSNLIYRDYASVMKDIQQPSAAINPDFVAYNIEPKDGEGLLALLQTETRDEITFVDGAGHASTLRKDRVKSMKSSPISFMPEGLLANLTAKQVKDLMTFLLSTPLQPASLEIEGVPAPRKEPEIKELLQAVPAKATNVSSAVPFKSVLCAGPKDHGPSEHDYPLWQKRWATLLALKAGATVNTAWEWPTDEQLQTANVIIFYSNNPGWNQERAQRLQAFLERGGGAVFVHFAIDGHDKSDLLAQIIGAAWQSGSSKFRHGPLKLKLEASPISKGFTSVEFNDESYWNLKGRFDEIQVIASSVEEGEARPQIWMKQHGKGRVFVCIPGHYTWTFDDPLYRILLLRGIAWAGGVPCDSLLELACIGSRVAN